MKQYDFSMKSIVDADPEAIAHLVLEQYKLLRGINLPLEGMRVIGQLNTEFQGTEADADGLLLIELDLPGGEKIMILVEFQSKGDKFMPDRLIDYSLRARHKHGRIGIIGCVILLRDKGTIPEPPYFWSVIPGYHNLAYDYLYVKMWELDREAIPTAQHPALLPLALLAKGETDRIMVRDVVEELHRNHLEDLILPAQIFASWVLSADDLEWLKKEIANMANLFEDSPVYQMLAEKEREKGRAEAQQQILEERQRAQEERQRAEEERQRVLEERQRALEGFRQVVVSLIVQGFPDLAHLARKQVESIEDQERLQRLILQITTTHDLAEMVKLLAALDE